MQFLERNCLSAHLRECTDCDHLINEKLSCGYLPINSIDLEVIEGCRGFLSKLYIVALTLSVFILLIELDLHTKE